MSYKFITKLSISSIKNFRVTLLFFISIIFIGAITYVQFLPREGFPELNFPTAFIQTIYPVEDLELVESRITAPIVKELDTLSSIENINSTSSNNFSFISISFKTETDVQSQVEKIQEKLINLPEGVSPEVLAVKPNTIDGENDLLIGINSDLGIDLTELQDKASEVAQKLNSLGSVLKAESINQFVDILNPLTGESEQTQLLFNRYGVKKDNTIKVSQNVLIGIQKEKNFTTTQLSKEVTQKIESILNTEEFQDFNIVKIYDEAENLNKQISSLESNAFGALLIVAITLFIFVSWRSSIVAVIFIPTVMAATFITLNILGISLNVISLFALILVLGLLVDDAIVIIESIDYYKRKGYRGIRAVGFAVSSVGKADLVGTITTLIAFFPMLFIIGFLGKIIRDIPITVIVTLIWSLIIALTVVPFLSNILIPSKRNKNIIYWILNFSNELVIRYGVFISYFVQSYVKKWYLNFFIIVMSLFLIFFGGFFASQLKFEDFPSQKDSNGISINFNFDEDISIEEKIDIAIQVEKVLNNYKANILEIKYPQVGRNVFGQDVAVMLIDLKSLISRSKTSVEIANSISKDIQNIKKAKISVQPEQVSGPPADDYQVKIQLYASNIENALFAAEEIKNYINSISFEEKDISIVNTRIKNNDLIVKSNSRRYLLIESKLKGDFDDSTIRSITDKVGKEFDSKRLNELGLEKDAIDNDRGFSSEIFESVISAGIALLGSFGLIYVFLVVIFNSFLRALIIMLSIPFSFFGLFAGLYFTNNSISFFVIIGMIALVGIVVNNAIMLLDIAIQVRSFGNSISDSISRSVRLRFRPLITTSATTILGLVPLALSEPFWESLALTIIFGLASSTFLILFAFPSYYVFIEGLRVFLRKSMFKIHNKV